LKQATHFDFVAGKSEMDKLKHNWFSEINSLWPGQCMSLAVEEILFHEKSAYQDVLVFKR